MIEKRIRKIKDFISGFLVTLGIMSFSLGFALFITSIIRLIESHDPKTTLLIGLGMMIIPVVLGIWEFKHLKKKIMHNLRRLKIE